MCQIINLVAILLLAGLSLVAAKCDMMKEFKPDIDDIMAWTQTKCGPKGSKTDLSQADLDKAKSCYTQHLQPKLASDCAKKVDAFMNAKVFGNPNIVKCCYDKKIQEDLKKCAMKDIGMKCGMGMKKECESDCPGWKTTLASFTSCCKS